jgi:hypothetical protein
MRSPSSRDARRNIPARHVPRRQLVDFWLLVRFEKVVTHLCCTPYNRNMATKTKTAGAGRKLAKKKTTAHAKAKPRGHAAK